MGESGAAARALGRPGVVRLRAAVPHRRIASGGELSRVMLAAKVVLGEADAVDTLVFDEVDAGVGGATARSLAQVLADLARTHQVIVVTHLAQVAVQGSVHYVVRRDNTADVPPTASSSSPAPWRSATWSRSYSTPWTSSASAASPSSRTPSASCTTPMTARPTSSTLSTRRATSTSPTRSPAASPRARVPSSWSMPRRVSRRRRSQTRAWP